MNALPVVEELKRALKELAEKGEPYTIYSNKMPTTLEDRYFLQEVLGKGDWFMYERVLHTKAVAFNTLIPAVWIELIFSERDPKEPILESVRVDFSPLNFTFPREDLETGFEKFKKDLEGFKKYLHPFAFEVSEAFEGYLTGGKPAVLKDPEGLQNLTYYLLSEGELILENEKEGRVITSTNYYGLWLERDREGNYSALMVGDFPPPLKPSVEEVKRAVTLLEERKNRFLPKYRGRVDLPLL